MNYSNNAGSHSAHSGVRHATKPSAGDLAAYNAENYTGRHSKRPKRRNRRKIIIAVIAAIVLLLVIPGAAFAMSAKGAVSDAKVMMSEGKTLMKQVKDGDVASAQQTAVTFAEAAKKLDDNTSGILWTGATFIPVYGSDISQVRTLASVAHTLADDVLTPIVNGLPADGAKIISSDTINVAAIQAVLTPVGQNADVIHKCAVDVQNMGEAHISQLQEATGTIKELFAALDKIAPYASDLSQELPGMLGAEGARTYLFMACTNAEIRCTGGMPGQFGLMTMDNGHMEFGDFSGADIAPTLSEEAKIAVPAEEEALFGERITMDVRDVNFIPDFERVGQLESQIWEATGNQAVDGVFAVDPIFLQRMLALTGGITTSDGVTVDGTNAAEVLLNTVYEMYPTDVAQTDRLFAEAAGLAVNQIFSNLGNADIAKFAETFVTSLQDGHFYMWFKDAGEEELLKELDFAGTTSTDEAAPELGVYFGSAMGCKIFWYLDADVEMSEPTKNADGSESYDVTVTFTNTLSEAEAAQRAPYIVGYDISKRAVSDMMLDIYVYAPWGGTISNMQTNGYFTPSDYYNAPWNTRPGTDPMTPASYNGHEVWYGMTQIMGDSTTTLSFTVTTSPNAEEPLALSMTPLPNENI